jgi:hypothetical protein
MASLLNAGTIHKIQADFVTITDHEVNALTTPNPQINTVRSILTNSESGSSVKSEVFDIPMPALGVESSNSSRHSYSTVHTPIVHTADIPNIVQGVTRTDLHIHTPASNPDLNPQQHSPATKPRLENEIQLIVGQDVKPHIPLPLPLNPAIIKNDGPIIRSSSASSSASSSHSLNHNKLSSHRSIHHRNIMHKKTTPILIEDEYKETCINYDDDDADVKKIKASLFNFVKDIAFNLIFTLPALRSKLKPILNNPSLAINEIEQKFDDFKDQFNKTQLDNIKKYVCAEGVRDKLNYILEVSFKKILSDGKIDIDDAPQFIQLVYCIIHSFNTINDGEVFKFAVSRDHVMLLLHFILKSVFCLTLDTVEERMAIGLLDTSFKLIKIEVCPLVSKKWYHIFRKCWTKKKVFEDLTE